MAVNKQKYCYTKIEINANYSSFKACACKQRWLPSVHAPHFQHAMLKSWDWLQIVTFVPVLGNSNIIGCTT